MTIEQTVEIDRDRRVLRLDQPLPESVGAGRTTVTLTFPDIPKNVPAPDTRTPEQIAQDRDKCMEIIHDYYQNAPSNNEILAKFGMKPEPTWDELHAEARAKAEYYKDRPFVSLRAEGLEKRSREQIIEDAIAEVRALRDEWDD
jgi:hypothetical protein